VFLNGDAIPGLDPRGERVVDDTFYVLFNGHHEPLAFRLPARPDWGERWTIVFDTAQDGVGEPGETVAVGGEVKVEGRAVVVLMREE
jgi:isoamylase